MAEISITYTVIIFLARTGRTRAVKFRPKNFGRISFDLGEISPIQQILRLSNGRNSPKLGEIRPIFLRANLNCADSPISNKFRPKKNYCVPFQVYYWIPGRPAGLTGGSRVMAPSQTTIGSSGRFQNKQQN
jgi:hypothetical protein